MTIKSALVIDDSADMREHLHIQLRQLGVENIVEADNSHSALAELRTRLPQVVFLDIHLGEENGIELLSKLRSVHRDLAVIMVSGDSTIDNVRLAIAAGARGFMVKPLTEGKVAEALKGLEAVDQG